MKSEEMLTRFKESLHKQGMETGVVMIDIIIECIREEKREAVRKAREKNEDEYGTDY